MSATMKKKILIRGPLLSRSGYGEQSRFAFRSIQSREDIFDIYVDNISWGATAHTARNTEEDKVIKNILTKTQQYVQTGGQFDISLQITVPNEFQKIAPINIGYTAGIETTKVAPEWIAKSNENINRIITISNHSKKVLEQTKYDVTDQDGNKHPGWGLQVPVTAVNYPVRKYTPEALDFEFVTGTNFLTVGQWAPRKNLDNTIKWFVEAFKDNEDVGLVVKTNFACDSRRDKEVTSSKLKGLLDSLGDRKCKIYLLHGEVSPAGLGWLYEHPTMKALINIGHGEGFGLPLFEAVCHGLPIITVSWSGQTDFIYTESKKGSKICRTIQVDYDINTVQKEAVWPGFIQEDAQWCFPREASFKRALQDCLKKEAHHKKNAVILQKYVLKNFTAEQKYAEFVDAMGLAFEDNPDSWLAEIEDIVKEYE